MEVIRRLREFADSKDNYLTYLTYQTVTDLSHQVCRVTFIVSGVCIVCLLIPPLIIKKTWYFWWNISFLRAFLKGLSSWYLRTFWDFFIGKKSPQDTLDLLSSNIEWSYFGRYPPKEMSSQKTAPKWKWTPKTWRKLRCKAAILSNFLVVEL